MISQLFINGILSASFYAITALSFALIYSISRFFHFAHALIFTFGAYFVYLFYNVLTVPFAIAILLSLFFCAILGYLIEYFIYKPLRKKNASPLILLISSLGIYTIGQNTISILFGDDTKTINSGTVKEGLQIFNAHITPFQLVTILISLMLSLLAYIITRKTIFGKSFRAVSNNSQLAIIYGVQSDKIFLYTYLLGSALVGIAGILAAYDVGMSPTMGFNALVMGVIVMIIGGVGSIPGIILGALVLGLAQHLGVWKIASQWQDAIAFGILLIFLILKPKGFFGKPIKQVEI